MFGSSQSLRRKTHRRKHFLLRAVDSWRWERASRVMERRLFWGSFGDIILLLLSTELVVAITRVQ